MILVTGGAGYIGSHFVKHYLGKYPDKKIAVVDDLSGGHQEALLPGLQGDRVLFYAENVGQQEAMKKILGENKISAVVYFAGSIAVGESEQKPHEYMHNNVTQALNFFQSMQDAGVKKIVFSSSCATYGTPKTNFLDEEHSQIPESVYGLTKLICEQILHSYARTALWQATFLRYFNAAGADESALIGESHNEETHLIPLVLQNALGKRKEIEIYGDDYDTPDGTCIRDYVHVNDLAEAHCLALDLAPGQNLCQAFNLGTASGASVKEIISLCQEITGSKIKTKISPRRKGDVATLVALSGKAEKVLGWQPRYDLKQIIQTAWLWEKNKSFGKAHEKYTPPATQAKANPLKTSTAFLAH